jgi:NADPH:quinone reductase-like Zn-dependent oxidoreductase
MTMRQVWIPKAGPPDVLQVREAPDPQPAAGQVRMQVEAAGVNFADLMARIGQYQDAPPMPCVVGYEVAGTIDAVGAGVDSARIGEPVLAMCRFGGYSSQICLPSENVARRPEGMSAVVGAAIPVNYLTAWMMLRVMAPVQPGERVFIHAAAGGVGLAAIDLCRVAGAEMWGSAGTKKHAFLQERGCQHVVDSHADEWPAEKMDLVLDAKGGASWARGLQQLRGGGRIVCFGLSSGSTSDRPSTWSWLKAAASIPWVKTNPVALINGNHGVLGINMGTMWGEGERCRAWLDLVLAAWTRGEVRPHVHATVPFAQAAEAHAILHRRENVGKVVLVP